MRIAEVHVYQKDLPVRGTVYRMSEGAYTALDSTIVEIVSDTGLSDPSALNDDQLAQAVETLVAEELEVSEKRAAVIAAHDRLQEELKRRYKQDISQVLS